MNFFVSPMAADWLCSDHATFFVLVGRVCGECVLSRCLRHGRCNDSMGYRLLNGYLFVSAQRTSAASMAASTSSVRSKCTFPDGCWSSSTLSTSDGTIGSVGFTLTMTDWMASAAPLFSTSSRKVQESSLPSVDGVSGTNALMLVSISTIYESVRNRITLLAMSHGWKGEFLFTQRLDFDQFYRKIFEKLRLWSKSQIKLPKLNTLRRFWFANDLCITPSHQITINIWWDSLKHCLSMRPNTTSAMTTKLACQFSPFSRKNIWVCFCFCFFLSIRVRSVKTKESCVRDADGGNSPIQPQQRHQFVRLTTATAMENARGVEAQERKPKY